jgi:hypothetical protein
MGGRSAASSRFGITTRSAFDTRVVFGTRELFVKSLQNVDEQNVELRLLCEEVINQ